MNSTRLLRRVVTAVAGVLAVLALVVVGGLPVYVFPSAPPVEKADLIYVLGPPSLARLTAADELRKSGVADRTLISVSSSGGRSSSMSVCATAGVTCIHPQPATTKGEAALLGAFAAENAVHTTVVLTFTPHVARTRYIFQKCYAGDVIVLPVQEKLTLSDWIHQYLYQSAAFVKAWLTPCDDLSDF